MHGNIPVSYTHLQTHYLHIINFSTRSFARSVHPFVSGSSLKSNVLTCPSMACWKVCLYTCLLYTSPGILPCISLRIISPYTFRMSQSTRIKRSLPCSICFARTHKLGFSIKAVSYTHLDVYKRQLHGLGTL